MCRPSGRRSSRSGTAVPTGKSSRPSRCSWVSPLDYAESKEILKEIRSRDSRLWLARPRAEASEGGSRRRRSLPDRGLSTGPCGAVCPACAARRGRTEPSSWNWRRASSTPGSFRPVPKGLLQVEGKRDAADQSCWMRLGSPWRTAIVSASRTPGGDDHGGQSRRIVCLKGSAWFPDHFAKRPSSSLTCVIDPDDQSPIVSDDRRVDDEGDMNVTLLMCLVI